MVHLITAKFEHCKCKAVLSTTIRVTGSLVLVGRVFKSNCFQLVKKQILNRIQRNHYMNEFCSQTFISKNHYMSEACLKDMALQVSSIPSVCIVFPQGYIANTIWHTITSMSNTTWLQLTRLTQIRRCRIQCDLCNVTLWSSLSHNSEHWVNTILSVPIRTWLS